MEKNSNFDEKLPNFWTRCLRIVDRNMFTHGKTRASLEVRSMGEALMRSRLDGWEREEESEMFCGSSFEGSVLGCINERGRRENY